MDPSSSESTTTHVDTTAWETTTINSNIQRRKRRRRQRKSLISMYLFLSAFVQQYQFVDSFVYPKPSSSVNHRRTTSPHPTSLYQPQQVKIWASEENVQDGDNNRIDSSTDPSKSDEGTTSADSTAERSYNKNSTVSMSRDRAISALSQPPSSFSQDYQKRDNVGRVSKISSGRNNNNNKNGRGYHRRGVGFAKSPTSSDSKKNVGGGGGVDSSSESFSSLLPPPIKGQSSSSSSSTSRKGKDGFDPLSEGLSSWEDFLGGGRQRQEQSKQRGGFVRNNNNNNMNSKKGGGRKNNKNIDRRKPNMSASALKEKKKPRRQQKKGSTSLENSEQLPSIADLFPPDLSEVLSSSSNQNNVGQSTSSKSTAPKHTDGDQSSSSSTTTANNNNNGNTVPPPPPSLDGVLPVSDLFYRSAQSMSDDEDEIIGDDEELPFSAEQSNTLTTEHNKIKIRRNQSSKPSSSSTTTTKPTSTGPPPQQQQESKMQRQQPKRSNNNNRRFASGGRRRKMVRRGMEMLVGGVPINADPPQRSVEMYYQHEDSTNWHEVVSLNSRDFGPILYSPSVDLLSKTEQGLFCEHFTQSAIKWDVCPEDLKTIVDEYLSSLLDTTTTTEKVAGDSLIAETSGLSERPIVTSDHNLKEGSTISALDAERELHRNYLADLARKHEHERGNDDSKISALPGLGFGTLTNLNDPSEGDGGESYEDGKNHLGGELVFSIGVSKEELVSADSDPSTPPVLERVLVKGIIAATNCNSFDVSFQRLILVDMDDGTTMVTGDFVLAVKDNENMTADEIERKAQRINSSLAQAMDDGDMQLALAAAAKEEMDWSQEVRDRVVEEFLFEDDDADGPLDEDEDIDVEAEADLQRRNKEFHVIDGAVSEESGTDLHSLQDFMDEVDKKESPLILPEDGHSLLTEEAFLGGGDDGVFWNYSGKNKGGSPYGGALGLRMVDAVVQRAKERNPRVIAIGDVHGCIDELQDLLRSCDYRPGDLVVFLGDLVSKGPDSISVVQMAREIGAIGVRGNHDFEVIRWHQAIQSGVDPPVVGSEHFHIASCLTKGDMKWMCSLPWYISSKNLGALFVHAGFVSGIRLGKQNPRLMMNMRSILPDGTVTSKFFNNWPWARLWDGPQTVLFGHDADRGLQQYEHAIGLDTGCVYGGRLTACILPEKRLVSVSARGEYFKYRRKHYE